MTAEVGKLRLTGHMWPDEQFDVAHRAFRIISLQDKLKGLSA